MSFGKNWEKDLFAKMNMQGHRIEKLSKKVKG